MKIRRLYIKDWQQFKEKELIFVYPVGHPKEGQAMEKVCFIGQSGTGKTTLLKIISIFGFMLDNPFIGNNLDIEFEVDVSNEKSFIKTIENKSGSLIKENKEWLDHLERTHDKYVIQLGADIVSNSKVIFDEKIIKSNQPKSVMDLNNSSNKFPLKKEEYKEIEKSKNIFISGDGSEKIWHYLMKEIDEYDEQLSQKGIQLIRNDSLSNLGKMKSEIEKWKKDFPNPRVDLADKCLNPILNKFNLEINKDTVKTPIKVRNINAKEDLDSHGISTGTKQFIQTAIPLYKLNTDGAILLIDEPERSLFPDIQLELIDYYKSLCPDSQMFVATHSPIIAASFEPCERFILYFDEEGEVQIKNGEAPKGDDPNDILHDDFNVNILNKYGMAQWERYRTIKRLLHSTKDEDNKKELLREYRELGDAYNFKA